jgi:hypothetical protein
MNARQALGFWSGIFSAVLALAFTLLMGLDVAGIFHGTLQLVPVLLLAPCYLALMSCIHEAAAPEKKIWSLLALVLSVPYGVIVSFNYLMQLTVVRQNPALYPWLAMVFRPDSMFGALELLGYGWQSLALLALVPVFAGRPVLRGLLLLNGLLAVGAFAVDVVTGNPVHPVIFASLGVWCLAFPLTTAMIGVWLKARFSG